MASCTTKYFLVIREHPFNLTGGGGGGGGGKKKNFLSANLIEMGRTKYSVGTCREKKICCAAKRKNSF